MKIPFSLLFLLFSATSAFADATSANTFATQAGTIAGAAQACGQDVSEFSNRVNQGLAILATTTNDLTQALQTYQTAIQNASQKQMQSAPIPCTQVVNDYNNMPIMQQDYQNTVLEKFKQSANKPVSFLPPQTPQPTNAPQNAGVSTAGVPNSLTFPNPDPNVSAAGVPNSLTFPANSAANPPTPVTNNPPTNTLPTTPTQFNAPNTTPTGAPTGTANTDMSYAPNSAVPTAPAPTNSSIPAVPTFQ